MSRLMSVAFTEDAVRARKKTVTRRLGWWEDKNGRRILKPGDHLTLCRKVMGRKNGEPLERIAEVEVVDVRRERLGRLLDDLDYGFAETTLEGFQPGHPAHFPSWFVERYFIDEQGILPSDDVTRIEWRYLDEDPS